jgi:hypothetical protein
LSTSIVCMPFSDSFHGAGSGLQCNTHNSSVDEYRVFVSSSGHDTTRHDTTRHDTTRHDTARHQYALLLRLWQSRPSRPLVEVLGDVL